MSVLNLPLAYMALKRKDMPEWAKHKVKICSSMSAVREVGKKVEKDCVKATAAVEQLQKKVDDLATFDAFKLLLFIHIGYIFRHSLLSIDILYCSLLRCSKDVGTAQSTSGSSGIGCSNHN